MGIGHPFVFTVATSVATLSLPFVAASIRALTMISRSALHLRLRDDAPIMQQRKRERLSDGMRGFPLGHPMLVVL
jgi:hypothetical protein